MPSWFTGDDREYEPRNTTMADDATADGFEAWRESYWKSGRSIADMTRAAFAAGVAERTRPAPEFVWVSADPADPDDLQTCRSVPGYSCVIECMDDDRRHPLWHAAVYRADDPRAVVFHDCDADVNPKTAKAARDLCEMAVLADLFRRAAPTLLPL